MSELVTDEMVGMAARAEWAHEWPDRPWERVPDDLADHYRDCSRVALEAAAPAIAAKAMRDFADGMTSGLNKETLNAERRAIKREARARADRIEANAPESGAEKRATPCSAVKSGHHCKRFDPHGDSHVWLVTAKEER